MAIGAQSEERGEQSLLELRPPQPAGLSSRGVLGNSQPLMAHRPDVRAYQHKSALSPWYPHP
jgi:hypothetical protein